MNKLTNADIVERILEIRQILNACARAEALKSFEKEYKHTQFYKRTHKKLTTLYYEIALEDMLTLRSLLQSVQDFLNNLDATHFTEMMDQVNDNARATYTDGLSALSESGLVDLFKSFKKA